MAVQVQCPGISIQDIEGIPLDNKNGAGIVVEEQPVGLFGFDQFFFEEFKVGDVDDTSITEAISLSSL